jgi:hypothetical protein
MKLLALLDNARKRVEVQELELYFKKLNWKELGEFQEFSAKIEDSEEEELNSTVKICEYILDKYVTDEDGNKVIEKKDVKSLPVDFSVELVEKFISALAGEREELKKK